MEVVVLIFIVLFFAPLIMSIAALVKNRSLSDRVQELEESVKQLESSVKRQTVITESPYQYTANPVETSSAAGAFSSETERVDSSESEEPPEIIQEPTPVETPPTFAQNVVPPAETCPPIPQQPVALEAVDEQDPPPPPEWQEFLHGLIFRGNPIAKIAMIILIFGVGFAIKLAVQEGLFPIEFRLVLVAFGGLIMTLIGLKLREKERTYAKILMGGGLTIIYLTSFGAGRLWHLLPHGLALGLMIVCVIASTGLAHFIKSQSMAILSFSGGYLAPILISTGSRDHLQLFTLYLILNLAILFLAKRHDWRWLTVFGFFCTYVLGMIWGFSDYRHHHFSTVEPFLLANWLIYLYAGHFLSLKRGRVIVTLILGPTLASFGLQSLMLRSYLLWMALSCVMAGLVHVAYGYWLQRHEKFPLLEEFNRHIALGLITVSIPLALSERWTSAAWSVEAVALVWVGMRSNRWILKLSGVGLLVAAGVSLVVDWPLGTLSQMLSCTTIALSSLVCARLTFKTENRIHDGLFWLTFLWASAWWLTGLAILGEENFREFEGLFIYWSLTVIIGQAISLKWRDWSFLSNWGFPLIIFGIITYVEYIEHTILLPGIFIIALTYWTLTKWHLAENRLHGFFNILLLSFIGVTLVFWLDHFPFKALVGQDWNTWLYPAIFGFIFIPTLVKRDVPPWSHIKNHPVLAGILYLAPISIWFFFLNLVNAGDFAPLPYIPILNPAEVFIIGFVVMVWIWKRKSDLNTELVQVVTTGGIILAFSFSLGLVSRFAHHYWSIPWQLDDMLDSSKWQGLLAVEWTLFGMVGLVSGSRNKSRSLWVAGAAVTGLVVLKLFLIDLRFSGTGPRVITFLAVGILLLIVGYKAPLPPVEMEEIDELKD